MPEVALRLAPGAGLVSRRPAALLYTAAADGALVEAFLAAPEGAERQALASATVAAGFEVGPYVCLTWDGELRVMAFGDVAVETDQPSIPMLSGAGSRTWVEHALRLDGSAVVHVAGDDTDAATDLVAGTVHAGGFRLHLRPSAVQDGPVGDEPVRAEPGGRRSAAADPAAPGAPAAHGAVDETTAVPRPSTAGRPARVVDVDPDDPMAALAAIQAAAVDADGEPLAPPGAGAAAAAAPASPSSDPPSDQHDPDVTLPPPASEALLADVLGAPPEEGRGSLVDAKRCAAGHANPPTAATCAVCGDFLAPGAAAVVHVPRPSLGRLRLDDGELVELDQEVLIGRNPDRDQDPRRAGLRRVRTPGEKVSRSHLEVRFQGWDVLVADCGSTNGTFVVAHAGGQVAQVEPDRPHMIDAGAVVYFGSRSFTLLGREEAR